MKYTEEDLVSFGLYLLSEERTSKFGSFERLNQVHHADLENWKEKNPRN